VAKKRHYLTATLPDGYVKTIGPTALELSHYWRVVAVLANGKTEVFWGHAKSLREANGKKIALAEAAAQRGWISHSFDVVELVRSTEPPRP